MSAFSNAVLPDVHAIGFLSDPLRSRLGHAITALNGRVVWAQCMDDLAQLALVYPHAIVICNPVVCWPACCPAMTLLLDRAQLQPVVLYTALTPPSARVISWCANRGLQHVIIAEFEDTMGRLSYMLDRLRPSVV